MFKIGDYVTRKSYNNDIIFEIIEIINDSVMLKGVNIRLVADSNINDLSLADNKKNEDDFKLNEQNLLNRKEDDYFYIPGKILHIDGDKDYLERCLNFYKKANVLAIGLYIKEENLKNTITETLQNFNPDIVVITGHDSKIKNNSIFFSEAVKECRKYQKDYDKLIIIAGACQSDYKKLIKAGANFASSPKGINIHALDPAIIALTISLQDKKENINLIELLAKTSCGIDGIGGVETKGTMTVGYPR